MTTIAALEHGDVGRTIRRLAVPNALAFLGDQFLGIVDTIAIGSLGTGALAAITAASSVFLVIGIGLFAFGSGLRIVGAQAIGGGRSDRYGTIVRSATVVPVAIALLAVVAFAAGGVPLMRAMLPAGAPAVAAGHYLVLRGACLIPIVLSGQTIVAFATAGDARLAPRVLVAINAVHVPLLFVLALGVGTHHPLGLTGAGLSSFAAECAGLAYALYAARRRPELGIVSSWRIEPGLVRATASLSWPEFVFLTLQILPDPLTIGLLAPAGSDVVAAYRALSIVNDATWAIPGSLGDACQIVLGQRIGAGDYAGARAFLARARRIGIRVSVATGLGVAVFAWPLAAVCTLHPALATVAALPLAVHALLTLPLKGYAMTTIAPIRASGDTRWVMGMGIATTAIAMTGIATGIVALHLALWAVPLGWVVAWSFRNVATTLRLRGGDWERRRIAVAH